MCTKLIGKEMQKKKGKISIFLGDLIKFLVFEFYDHWFLEIIDLIILEEWLLFDLKFTYLFIWIGLVLPITLIFVEVIRKFSIF